MEEAINHALLLLSIKKKGQWIPLSHIWEKVSRDLGFLGIRMGEEEFNSILLKLRDEGLVEERGGNYRILRKGYDLITERIPRLSGMNRSYLAVYHAKRYYPKISKLILPFLEGRAVSVVKIFSDKKDPINRISPSFVRYSSPKQKKPNLISTEKELIKYVDMHAIDFIPYVHRLGSDKPDWLVIDVDAGGRYETEEGFFLLKEVVKAILSVLDEHDVKGCPKFSGSRGIQVWASIDYELPPSYRDAFALFRDMIVYVQKKTEEKLKESRELYKRFTKITKGKDVTTSKVAKKEEREDQFLIDWSSMKPSGDVRAPYSIHYKTGMVSCPITDLDSFELSHAQIDSVLRNPKKFDLPLSDGKEILRFF